MYREYKEWLGDEEMLEYVIRGFTRAETKLESCLSYEEALVNGINFVGIINSIRRGVSQSFFTPESVKRLVAGRKGISG